MLLPKIDRWYDLLTTSEWVDMLMDSNRNLDTKKKYSIDEELEMRNKIVRERGGTEFHYEKGTIMLDCDDSPELLIAMMSR